ncbi:MAG: arginine deiminase family protein [bacterium]
MLRNEGDALTRVVVCKPGHDYFNVDHLESHNMNEIPDPGETQRQHDKLKSIMTRFGCEVIGIPELSGHPNSVFTRDVALSTPEGYIKLRMGLDTRRGEEEWMSQFLAEMGEPCVGEIEAPGTVEGGDIILAGRVAFVGLSHRTNDEGITQLSIMLRAMNYEVRTFSVKGLYLHLGGAMSVIGPQRALCCKGVFPDDFFAGFDTIEVPHKNYSASVGNVICLKGNEVIATAAENMETIKVLEDHGVKVHAPDLSEFRKGGGGPTCLILPVERK